MKRGHAINKLKRLFLHIKGIKKTEDHGFSAGGIHLGDCAEGGTIDGMTPACNYYIEFYDLYIFGVYKRLHEALEEIGWYAECQNPGEYIAWEN